MASGRRTVTRVRAVPPRRESSTESDEMNTQPVTTTTRQQSARIPKEEWNAKRAIITELYPNKTLNEVMEILDREHNFRPTQKMYKSRISKWGLDKKLKSDEVLAILRLRRDREALNKKSEFYIRNNKVDMDNINRYVKRNPHLNGRLDAGEVPSKQCSKDVTCTTPPPSPRLNPAVLPIPNPFAPQIEEIINLFGQYIITSLSSGVWICEYNGFCRSIWSTSRVDELFERLIESFALINRCVRRGESVETEKMLKTTIVLLQEIIQQQSPTFVIRSILLLWYFQQYDVSAWAFLSDSVSQLSVDNLGNDHPMSRVWLLIKSIPHEQYFALSDRLYTMLATLLSERIGPANYLTTVLYGDHIDYLNGQSQSEQALEAATEYRNNIELTGKRDEWHLEFIMVQTSLVSQSKEAAGLREEAVECFQLLRQYPITEEQNAGIQFQIANLYYYRRDYATAIQCYREALQLLANIENDGRLLVSILANLERALKRNDRAPEAERVRQYRMKRIEEMAADTQEFADSKPMTTEPQQQYDLLSFMPLEFQPSFDANIPQWLWLDDQESQYISDDFMLALNPVIVPVTTSS